MTRDFPSASAFFASSMAALIACELSGAGMIPSDLENVTAASKQERCGYATASISLSSSRRETSGAAPW